MSVLGNLLKSAWARLRRDPEAAGGIAAAAPRLEALRDAQPATPPGTAFHAGLERLRAGDFPGAERHLSAAVEHAPGLPEAHFHLGIALARQQRYEEAADCFVLATHFRPDFAEAHFQLGLAEFHRDRFDEALASFRRATELRPGYADAHCNLGYLLYKHLEQLDEAEEHLRRALALDPASIDARTNLAMVLDHRGATDEALAMYDRILEVAPGDPEVRLNRALIRLMRADYAQGWPDYEARRSVQRQRAFPYPEWDGSSLAGRTILVHAEQGLGDEIMFASCLGEVIARAGHCVVECHRKLEKLFRRSFPGATVHGALQTDADLAWLDRMPKIDCKIGIGSLPLHFRRSLADFPRHTGYLKADATRVADWRARLDALGRGPKIGISWRGGAKKTRRHVRSIPLEQWGPLLAVPGVHFVSLQYTDCRAEIGAVESASGIRVHHWRDAIDEYDETAALVAALDLVISVQTAVVHLAGALGKPVWALVSASPEWRYQKSGESLPWYPSVRLLRQSTPGDWQAVVNEARERLAACRT